MKDEKRTVRFKSGDKIALSLEKINTIIKSFDTGARFVTFYDTDKSLLECINISEIQSIYK